MKDSSLQRQVPRRCPNFPDCRSEVEGRIPLALVVVVAAGISPCFDINPNGGGLIAGICRYGA